MGLDINLSNLQALSEQGNRELYDGVGQVGILSPAGLFAGNSRDAGLLGKNLAKADPQHAGELLQLLAAGKSQLFNENDDLKVLQPLQPIPGAKPWACSSKCRRAPCSARPWRWSGNWTTCVAKAPGSNWASASAPRCSACWCCG